MELDEERAVPFMVFVAMEARGLAEIKDVGDGLEILLLDPGAEYVAELRAANPHRTDPDESVLAAAIWAISQEAFGSEEAAIENLLHSIAHNGQTLASRDAAHDDTPLRDLRLP